MTDDDDGLLGGISLVTLDVDIEAELAAQYKVRPPLSLPDPSGIAYGGIGIRTD